MHLYVLHLAVKPFRARDGAKNWPRIAIFAYPTCIRRPYLAASRRNIAITFGTEKLEWRCYRMAKKRFEDTFIRFERTWQTDRRTDTARRHWLRLYIASRGKTLWILKQFYFPSEYNYIFQQPTDTFIGLFVHCAIQQRDLLATATPALKIFYRMLDKCDGGDIIMTERSLDLLFFKLYAVKNLIVETIGRFSPTGSSFMTSPYDVIMTSSYK